jgi:molybdenum-dependent DNA-binding transcriptional regulator ModE
MKGTIFEKSTTSLQLWFYAMFLMASTRCGISAKQLERELGVTYKTAWRMFNKIRNELMNDEGDSQLEGKVEGGCRPFSRGSRILDRRSRNRARCSSRSFSPLTA